MLNDELIYYAHAILLSRIYYFEKKSKRCMSDGSPDTALQADAMASAYKSAYDILWYAINDNENAMKEFDYYAD